MYACLNHAFFNLKGAAQRAQAETVMPRIRAREPASLTAKEKSWKTFTDWSLMKT